MVPIVWIDGFLCGWPRIFHVVGLELGILLNYEQIVNLLGVLRGELSGETFWENYCIYFVLFWQKLDAFSPPLLHYFPKRQVWYLVGGRRRKRWPTSTRVLVLFSWTVVSGMSRICYRKTSGAFRVLCYLFNLEILHLFWGVPSIQVRWYYTYSIVIGITFCWLRLVQIQRQSSSLSLWSRSAFLNL